MEDLTPEGDFKVENDDDGIEDWTAQDSSIEFENVSLRYRDGLPLVLSEVLCCDH